MTTSEKRESQQALTAVARSSMFRTLRKVVNRPAKVALTPSSTSADERTASGGRSRRLAARSASAISSGTGVRESDARTAIAWRRHSPPEFTISKSRSTCCATRASRSCASLAGAANAKPSGTGRPALRKRASAAALGPTTAAVQPGSSSERITARGASGHAGDLVNGKERGDLGPAYRHQEHLLQANAPLEHLAMLGLQGEAHALLNLDGIVERVDAADHRQVVLSQTQAVTPQVGGGLVLLLVAPHLLRRRPAAGDVAGGGAHFDGIDARIQPFQRLGVHVLLRLARFATDAVGAVHARLVAVPR